LPQHLVIDLDLFGGIARLRQRLGNHHGNGIADVIRFALRDGGMRRHLHGRSVF